MPKECEHIRNVGIIDEPRVNNIFNNMLEVELKLQNGIVLLAKD